MNEKLCRTKKKILDRVPKSDDASSNFYIKKCHARLNRVEKIKFSFEDFHEVFYD
jgi:hypothetical protein